MPGETDFNELVSQVDYPMYVVTAAAAGERAGCLVGFTTQTSISPSRFLVCISRKNHTFGVASRAEALGVHLVPAEAEELAELFGGQTGDDVDKFARAAWRPGPGGVPLLDACANRFVGRVLERIDAGDHVAFLLEPTLVEQGTSADEFTFHRARRIDPGHEA
jgi:flavin reductase (DIM6/NTAB) family NADH-FMN oxidoreductase RutF